MGCSPPYHMGSGGFCGCNCNCCPPPNCYTSWTYVYLCGTSKSDWGGGSGPQGPQGSGDGGCDCSSTSLIKPLPSIYTNGLPSLGIDFPDFEYPQTAFSFNENEMPQENISALALSSACTIPCSTVTITLSTNGCCLVGSGNSFSAVNGGTISLTCGSGCGKPFVCSLNGGGSDDFIGDGGSISVSITPPSSDCCSCCLISSYGTLLDTSGSPAFRKRNTVTGITKNYVAVNKQKLLNKVKRTIQAKRKI